MELRDYQQEAIEAIFAAYERGVRRQLVAMATGAGKTVVFASLVNRRLVSGRRALVLAHRDRLISQAADKISKLVPLSEIGIVMGEQNRLHAPCVVASVQTLARRRRLAVMPKFDLVIVDECHRSAADSYRRILAHVCHEQTLLLGVTATPSRTDGIGLDRVYDEIVYQIGILDLIRRGYLVPLRGQRITIEADFSNLRSQKDDEVAEIMDKANWCEMASEGWMKYARDRRTIAFVPRVAMAHRLARYLRGEGVRAVALDGTTPQSVQRQVLADFERGEVQFLSSCDLLTEGVDLPSANCALLARPTESEIIYSQQVGRITRLSPETGKVDGLVLDLVGVTNHLDLCTLADLVGVKDLKEGETIVEAVEREKREAEEASAEQLTLPEIAVGEVVGREVDLLAAKEVHRRGVFEWHAYPARKTSVLKVAGHEFRIIKVGDQYTFADMGWGSRFQGQSYDYREARNRCEEEARRVLFGKNGGWRAEPATPNQIALMSRMRIAIPPHCTKGQASYLIEAKQKKARATA